MNDAMNTIAAIDYLSGPHRQGQLGPLKHDQLLLLARRWSRPGPCLVNCKQFLAFHLDAETSTISPSLEGKEKGTP